MLDLKNKRDKIIIGLVPRKFSLWHGSLSRNEVVTLMWYVECVGLPYLNN